MKQIQWTISQFEELDTPSLYNILKLRSEVFVLEQNCCYQDLDGKDEKAVHLQGFCDEKLVAYCRLFRKGDYFTEASIGRVVVSIEYRRSGLGHQLIRKAIELQKELLKEQKVTISAQLYLKKFYEKHGFVQTSDQYQEDSIAHIQMKIEIDRKK